MPWGVFGFGVLTGACPNLSGLSFMKRRTRRANAKPTIPGAYMAYLHCWRDSAPASQLMCIAVISSHATARKLHQCHADSIHRIGRLGCAHLQPNFLATLPTSMGARKPPTLLEAVQTPQTVPRSVSDHQVVMMRAHAGAPKPCRKGMHSKE